jgi:hypothetical protein
MKRYKMSRKATDPQFSLFKDRFMERQISVRERTIDFTRIFYLLILWFSHKISSPDGGV